MKIIENKTKLDSFELWIERADIEIINDNLERKIIEVYEETGEIKGTQNQKPIYTYEDGGITYRTGLKRMPIKDYITIIITAKMLKEKYFEGINKKNIKTIWETIINQKIIKCSYETFLNAMIRDIDICKDIYIENKEETLKQIKESCNKKLAYIKLENKEERKAIYFNNRENATITNPYIKIYDKGLELKTKSQSFREMYLKKYDTKNLIRIEATIKNNKMAKNYIGKELITKFRTLKDLLEIENNKNDKSLSRIIKYTFNKYKNEKTYIKMNTEKQETPTEAITRALLRIVIETQNWTEQEIIEETRTEYKNKNKNVQKVTRYRIQKAIEKQIQILMQRERQSRVIIYTQRDYEKLIKCINQE